MHLEDLEYYAPVTLREAHELLRDAGDDAMVIAGGTSLLVDLKQGLVKTRKLISLDKLEALKSIRKQDRGVWIGALVTPTRLLESKMLKQQIPGLFDAGTNMAGVQIRNIATLGGNLCGAVPCADFAPPLLSVDAEVVLTSLDGERTVPLSRFFKGPRMTVVRKDEIMTGIFIPELPPHTGTAYEKFKLRGASAIAVVGAAARLTLDGKKIIDVRVAVGAAAPTPILIKKISEFLKGKELTQENLKAAGVFASQKVRPITDVRGSKEYRRDLAGVLTERALQRAFDRAQQ
ncbi:MAG: xanthine dehydrogenase family protein subunit M [Planctomycetota bacterium]